MKPMPPKILTPQQRRDHGRCMDCEWHPPTQSHHELCPAKPGGRRHRGAGRKVAT